MLDPIGAGMSAILALVGFVLAVASIIAAFVLLDRFMVARVEREERARCDACLSGGGVTMLPRGPRYPLCVEHQARLMRIMELERNMDMDGNYGT
jgi:hypothetical protein